MTPFPVEAVVVGSANVDLSVRVERMPVEGETVFGGPVVRGCGGKGLNQAVALARLGRHAAFVAAVGDDPDGARILELLHNEGIVAAVTRTQDPTGTALVLLDGEGESTIVVSPGANARLTAQDVRRSADLLAEAGVVLASHEVPAAVVAEAADLAGHLFVLNPAPGRPVAPTVLSRVDVLVPNRHELAVLASAEVPSTTQAVAAAARSLHGPRHVVVTLGERGALVCSGGLVVEVPAVAAEVVDATGAGDTFCAALADALLDGADPVEAAGWAVRVAAVTVTRHGAVDALPRRSDVFGEQEQNPTGEATRASR